MLDNDTEGEIVAHLQATAPRLATALTFERLAMVRVIAEMTLALQETDKYLRGLPGSMSASDLSKVVLKVLGQEAEAKR